MDDLRKEKRAPILLKVKYKSASVDEFIQQSGLDISRGGIFIKTKTPMDIGTVLKFEFQLSDGAPVIHGVGRVAWRRQADVATRDLPPGMGVKFIKLDPQSRTIVDRTVSERGTSPSRYDAGDEEPSGPQQSPIAAEPVTGPRPAAPAPPVAPPAAPAATSRAAASALKPSPAGLPLPPAAKPVSAGARPAPPGVFSAPTKAPAPPAAPASSGAFGASPRARDSASARATLPSADPFSDAEAPTSFFPKGPPASAPANEDSTQVRHVSEFLASVMNEAGASDHAVAAEAQATAEKARRREHEVEEQRLAAMEAQLFGDMGEQTASVPLRPVSLSPKAAVEKDFDPFASEPPRGSPEIANPVISRAPVPSVQTAPGGSMQASLAPSSKQAETGRQQGFGAAQTTASEAKFPAPELQKPVLALSPNDVPSLPPAKKSSPVVPLVVVALLLGGAAFWYFQLGGAQMIAGGAPATVDTPAPTPEPTPAPEPSAPEPTAAAPTEPSAPTEPTPPVEPTPTAPAVDPNAAPVPVVMADLQITATPKDATFTLDGVDQGKAPKRVKVAVGSTINVTVRAYGHKPMTQSYTVLAKNDPLRFKLETMSFVLTVRTIPVDAHVTARSVIGDNAQAMDLGYLSGPVTVNVTKSGFTKKQRQVGLDAFVERDGMMVAEIEVGLRRPGATVDGDVPVAEAPAPTAEPTPAPTPEPRPAPVEATPAPAPRPEPRPEPEPEPAPRPAPRPDPAPALPDNPF